MKRKIITLLLAISVSSAFGVTAMAADEAINGFYDLGAEQNVTITPYVGTTAATLTEKNIDDDEDLEELYESSDRLEVTYQAATANDHYGIILVDGSGLPTKDTEIYYINQETAGSTSVNFNVYPKLPAETTDMTLYISSSAEDFELVSVSMNYAVNASEATPEPTYTPGDINDDTEINIKDVVTLRQYVVGGYGVTIIEEASDVNDDTEVNIKDVVILRQYVVGGYGVELK